MIKYKLLSWEYMPRKRETMLTVGVIKTNEGNDAVKFQSINLFTHAFNEKETKRKQWMQQWWEHMLNNCEQFVQSLDNVVLAEDSVVVNMRKAQRNSCAYQKTASWVDNPAVHKTSLQHVNDMGVYAFETAMKDIANRNRALAVSLIDEQVKLFRNK